MPAGTGGAAQAAGLPAAAEEPIHVHSIHTEIEGAKSFHDWFAEQLRGWKSDGVEFLTIEEICRTLLSERTHAGFAREQRNIPVRRLGWTNLAGRATPVATGVGAEA